MINLIKITEPHLTREQRDMIVAHGEATDGNNAPVFEYEDDCGIAIRILYYCDKIVADEVNYALGNEIRIDVDHIKLPSGLASFNWRLQKYAQTVISMREEELFS